MSFQETMKAAIDANYLGFEKNHCDFRVYAIRRHGLQLYGSDLPYSYHLAAVESVLNEMGFVNYEYSAAAWLHDIIEDTEATYDEIILGFGGEIAAMVWACTGEGATRKEKVASIFKKLKEFPKAVPVKVADRVANISHSIMTKNKEKIEMYLNEWEDFRKNLEPLMEQNYEQKRLWAQLIRLIEIGNNERKQHTNL